MKQNIGKTDKVARVLLAFFFTYLGWSYSPWWYIVAAVILVPVFTGFCWPYTWFGINTKVQKKKRK